VDAWTCSLGQTGLLDVAFTISDSEPFVVVFLVGGMLLLASLDTFVGFVVFTMLPVMFVRLQVSGVVLLASGVFVW
jgi:hypothetical protein